jgi:hypothetical protein
MMRRKTSAIDTALSIENQKFMAWSGLLKWAEAVVVQAERIGEARRVQTLALHRHNTHEGSRKANSHLAKGAALFLHRGKKIR